MKAITIHQPWASLIAIGAKQFETRGWRTNYKGLIAIHASKKEPKTMLRSLPSNVQELIFSTFYDKLGIKSQAMKEMPVGCIVAIANLSECWGIGNATSSYGSGYGYKSLNVGSESIIVSPNGNEQSFGDWTPGRFAWELTDIKLIDPIPIKGQQGLWNFDESNIKGV